MEGTWQTFSHGRLNVVVWVTGGTLQAPVGKTATYTVVSPVWISECKQSGSYKNGEKWQYRGQCWKLCLILKYSSLVCWLTEGGVCFYIGTFDSRLRVDVYSKLWFWMSEWSRECDRPLPSLTSMFSYWSCSFCLFDYFMCLILNWHENMWSRVMSRLRPSVVHHWTPWLCWKS